MVASTQPCPPGPAPVEAQGAELGQAGRFSLCGSGEPVRTPRVPEMRLAVSY